MTTEFDSAAERFQDAAVDMLSIDYTAALSIIIGTFVSASLEAMRRKGHEPIGEVHFECGDSRDVTIHAPKAETAGG